MLEPVASNSPQLPTQMETDTGYEGAGGEEHNPDGYKDGEGRKGGEGRSRLGIKRSQGRGLQGVWQGGEGEGRTWGPSRQKQGHVRTCAGGTLTEQPLKHAGHRSKLLTPAVQGDVSGPELRGQCRA